MKRLMSFVGLVLLALSFAVPGSAQTVITSTTLSAAITATQTTITVASATGFAEGKVVVIPSFLNTEVMQITGVSGTTITVVRGASGTKMLAHSASARIWMGPVNQFRTYAPNTGGPCVYTSQTFMPWIDTSTGLVWTCVAYSPAGVASTWRATSVDVVTFNSIGQLR